MLYYVLHKISVGKTVRSMGWRVGVRHKKRRDNSKMVGKGQQKLTFMSLGILSELFSKPTMVLKLGG